MRLASPVFALIAALVVARGHDGGAEPPAPTSDPGNEYYTTIRPLIQKYCLGCHSTKLKKGSLDLERFRSPDAIRKDLKPWQMMIEQLEAGQMPPEEKPQPTAEERKKLMAWVRSFLEAEARAN